MTTATWIVRLVNAEGVSGSGEVDVDGSLELIEQEAAALAMAAEKWPTSKVGVAYPQSRRLEWSWNVAERQRLQAAEAEEARFDGIVVGD